MLLAIIFLLLLTIAIKVYLHKSTRLPPGPFSLPIFGNYFSIPSDLYNYASDLSKKYGPLVRLRFGSSDIIILNQFELIRDTLSSSAFATRPNWLSMALQSEFQASFAFRQHGPQWRFLRKTAVKALTILKVRGTSNVQSRCQRALDRLIKDFLLETPRNGWTAPVEPGNALFKCVCTIMGETCFGRQFDPEDPELWAILQSAQDVSKLTKIGSLTDCFPWAQVFMRGLIEQMRRDNDVFRGYVVGKLDKSAQNPRDDEEIHDLTDALRVVASIGGQEDSEAASSKTQTLIRHSALDLFGGGVFTTFTSLEWSLLLLAKHPQIADKMRREIKDVCSDRPMVTLEDRPHLIYSQATITEILRFSSTLPFGVPHGTLEATTINGYHIPENTPVLCNLWAVHHDPDTFPQPDKFDPDRFVRKTEDGFELNNLVARVIPFSTGIRRCPGEHLARQNLFLVLCNVVKRLDFELASEYEDLNKAENNFSRKPLPYKLRFCGVSEKYV